MSQRRFDLDHFFQEDARRIVAAREDAIRLHHSGDIRAAGNQVEVEVRRALASRMPPRYRVSHGHIVDYMGHVSPQLDLIISESLSSTPLFQSEDGTEYIPYESVYAVGEVKSTYSSTELPIKGLSDKLRGIKQGLSRQPTSRNPLFSFIIFVDSAKFNVTDVETFYRETALDELPVFACFLNLGILLRMKFLKNGYGQPIPVSYHTSPAVDEKPGEDNRWAVMYWGSSEKRLGANLMVLCVAILQHMQYCVLKPPNLYAYLSLAFQHEGGEVLD